MQCPKCQSDTKVLETRTIEAGIPKRRRECLSCHYRFNTLEVLEDRKPKQERPSEERPKPKPKEAKRPRQDRTVKKEQDDSEDYVYSDREELESLGIGGGRPDYF